MGESMAPTEKPPALAYLERTLADSYRKEIDQEENVWRSLPFFAATLALQLAALFQIIDKLPDPTTATGWISVALLTIVGALTLVSLGFLAASIYPQKFDYLAKEPALLKYAWELINDENDIQEKPFSALVTLKSEVVRQYAEAANHNRQINKLRERRRSIAGLAVLVSVSMTVFLVATTYIHYLSVRVDKEPNHAAAIAIPASASAGTTGNEPDRPIDQPSGSSAPTDASRH